MKINGMPTAHMAQQKYIKIKYEAKKKKIWRTSLEGKMTQAREVGILQLSHVR